ncbi:hypothetical protein DB30_01885 [Enhygromyxa salina]|uniref:Uncharacterized protein n=1 Tax=Enhygromyxa salina TaxID=215803 RepID=A0A0C2CLK5_9BACT|nr:hypothetical protein DB30_01885 [Enhygromyxa salina]
MINHQPRAAPTRVLRLPIECYVAATVGDVVNLNRFRKRKRKQEEQQQAERKRVVHGRTKADKRAAAAEREHADQAHAGHERERQAADPKDPDAPDPD